MTTVLTAVEARVLGALIEKQITTPEYYPLSLNALINACNQKSNRDPIMHVDEPAAREALTELQDKGMAGLGTTSDSRVAKYEHRLQEVFNFNRQETAILCELLLRGPQTPGELRSRAERMQHFDDLSVVHNTLQKLMQREPSLIKVLPRQPGRKEARYAQLLTGEPDVNGAEPEERHFPAQANESGDANRLTDLENTVVELRKELVDLQSQMAQFRKQFE
ncbi:MAG TPA: YceH family protein [Candidatus Eremiobacteraceae bacterium]|nr:YceH family protein [Candidatus Eremiobacteraceae bacterium]